MKNGKITNLTRIVARLTCFVVLLFSCPLFVHAEGVPLPYAPGQISGYVISSDELAILQQCCYEIGSSVNLYSDDVIIFKSSEGGWFTDTEYTDSVYYTIYVFDGSTHIFQSSFSRLLGIPTFNLFTSGDYIDVNLPYISKITFQRSNLGAYYNNMYRGNIFSGATATKRFYGDSSLVSIDNEFNSFSYNDYYPIYCHGQFETIDSNSVRGIFLTNNLIPISPEPEPVDPDWPEDPDPSIPNPNPPSPPSSPTIENLLSYIAELINYYGVYWRNRWHSQLRVWFKNVINNLREGFNSLYTNFVAFFKPYFDIFLGRIDEIIVTLKNSFTSILSLITDIKTALENVKKFFDYIVSIGTENGQFTLTTLFVNLFIPSSADINQAFIDTDSFALLTFFKTGFNKVSSIWDSIVNASVRKSIHVNGFVFHGVTIPGFDIDFSWFDNYKSYSDVIISAFLIINYIWFIFFRAPSFIRGHSNMGGAVGAVIDNHDSKGNVI